MLVRFFMGLPWAPKAVALGSGTLPHLEYPKSPIPLNSGTCLKSS